LTIVVHFVLKVRALSRQCTQKLVSGGTAQNSVRKTYNCGLDHKHSVSKTL
jgi:hypothetical protein